MLVSDFDYELPQEFIAQEPAPRREQARLLVLERETGGLHDARFTDIGQWLCAGDLVVINDTKVIPARVFGRLETGGKVELLLLRNQGQGVWAALTRPARKMRAGTTVSFEGFRATVLERRPDGMRVVRFEPEDITGLLSGQGELALPPYIRKKCEEPGRYQTVYAVKDGAVAAPTAGLHFTPEVMKKLRQKGVEFATVTLHAGLGTFRPVKTETVEEHTMHPEEFELGPVAVGQVNRALEQGRRVVCVGTTTVRVLENQAERVSKAGSPNAEIGNQNERNRTGWRVKQGKGETNLYIYPGYEWKIANALLTNFHLPKSTLLMLVSAFAGIENIRAAYRRAIAERYRFYSFGDAMLIV